MPIPPRKALTADAAFALMADRCARAELCRHDILTRLARYDLPAGAADAVLRRLERERYVDERRYAAAFVRDRFRANRWGAVRLRLELQRRGIDASVIDEALCQLDALPVAETLEHVLAQKMRTTRARTDCELMTKLLRFALSRGYDIEAARAALERVLGRDTDTEP